MRRVVRRRWQKLRRRIRDVEKEKKALKADTRKALTKAENMLAKAEEEKQKEVQKRIRAECHAVELSNSTEHCSHRVVRSLDKLADADADVNRNVRTTHRTTSAITAAPADPPPNGLLAAAVCKRDTRPSAKAFPVGLPEDYERMKVRVAKKGKHCWRSGAARTSPKSIRPNRKLL
ncbi:hypothetical protein PF007_g21485 [Phytophthora fragariae]|uniref:Uncharacterized protein n=1 Tax=Phytophthora fragariae TaxID=53985 RepID=A0A6A3QVV8_9STRA|nr:hypothetical protein PF007_g21485 [Phytophthora fragariae]